MKIEYFETRANIELPEITKELIDLVKDKSIAIFSTIQFLEQRDNLATKLQSGLNYKPQPGAKRE